MSEGLDKVGASMYGNVTPTRVQLDFRPRIVFIFLNDENIISIIRIHA